MSTPTTTNTANTTQMTIHLSEQQNLVKKHEGLDAVPGYVVVVFEKLERGGARFAKVVNSDERFKKFFPFWTSPQKYFGIAVNQSVLRYTFASPVTLDDAIHHFTLIFHLTYRAVDPRMLAQLHAQDPLNLLRKMIIEAISRSCKPRKWDMVKERFRELERLLLDSERGKIIQYAETLGIQVISLDLDKQLRNDDIKTDLKEAEAEDRKRGLKIEHGVKLTEHQLGKAEELEFAKNSAYVEKRRFELENEVSKTKDDVRRERDRENQFEDQDHDHKLKSQELKNQLDLQDNVDALHRRDQSRRLNEVKNKAIGDTFTNVSAGINTPDGMLEAFGAVQQMNRALLEDNGASATAALPSAGRLGLPSKEETLTSLLISDLVEITRWNYPDAKQRALRSAILHIIAEALLDDQADNAVLQKHVEKLNELASNLHPSLSQTQFHLIDRYRDAESLRRRLG